MASSSTKHYVRRPCDISQSRTTNQFFQIHNTKHGRTIPKHNLICWLRDRELGYTRSRMNTSLIRRTNVYRTINPSYSILMVNVPQATYIRRFSPNGQYLLAFSHDLESLIVYKYRGFERIYSDLSQCSSTTNYTRLEDNHDGSFQINHPDKRHCEHLRDHAFDSIFTLHNIIQIRSTAMGYSLNRNHIYCLFSRDQYAIVCASKLVNEQQHPPYHQLVQSNEDLNPLSRFYFEHFLIFLIDYSSGKICQQLEFQFDRIGLTLYNSTLAILSIQHQKLHLYHIDEQNGKLIELLTVGKFAQTEEEYLYKYSLPKHLSISSSTRLLKKKNFKRSSSLFERWDEQDTTGGKRARQMDGEIFVFEGEMRRVCGLGATTSFVREELHRPFTPPPGRITTTITSDEQPIVVDGNGDLPANLASSIFQRESWSTTRPLVTYPGGGSSSASHADYDNEMSTIDDDDDDDDPIGFTPNQVSSPDPSDDYWSLIQNHQQNQILLPMNDKQLCTLKQRLLTYLYKRSIQTGSQARFIHSFNDYLASKFYKVQFLSNEIILLKFAHEQIVNKRQQEQQIHYALFVVYEISSSTILNVFDDSSSELATIFENYNDDFRRASSSGIIHWSKIEFFPLSTQAGRRQFDHIYHHNPLLIENISMNSNQRTDDIESIKRLLMQLPLRTITHTLSPYLDLNLFSYDDKIVHIDDMIKTCPNNPVRFFCRDCQRMKFQLTLTNRSISVPSLITTTAAAANTTTTTTTIVTPTLTNNPTTMTTAAAALLSNTSTAHRRTTLATLWHPIEPFCITIQRWPRDLDNIHNFHLYRPPNLLLN